VRKDSGELVALLTPIVKAFITDNGWTATTMSQQVFGGHGFIKEWGMEQFVRDARINMIYEGTTASRRWTCWAARSWATRARRSRSSAS
jgi:alkylation response protein AidB-like acyl-CoA dehydrogenase